MNDTREFAATVKEVLEAGDYARIAPLMVDRATDDFVQEWPQSGERLSLEASRRISEMYPQLSGSTPAFTYRRMLGDGDTYVIEGTIDYGDGVPVSYVGIAELRDGRVARMTEYFANPFEPPAWRAGLTDRMEPAAASGGSRTA